MIGKNLGKVHTAEAKEKMKKPKSEEHKKKIGNIHRGKKRAPAAIAKLSAFNVGNKYALGKHWILSEENKRKMSQARRIWWAKKKAKQLLL